jgi:hypothetical protein
MNKSILTLFFVLLVGFPQVSSGEGLNLFGNKEGNVILHCGDDEVGENTYVVNLNQKTIKSFSWDGGVDTPYEITDVSEVYVKGRNTTYKKRITIWRYGLEMNGNVMGRIVKYKMKNSKEVMNSDEKCFFFKKRF